VIDWRPIWGLFTIFTARIAEVGLVTNSVKSHFEKSEPAVAKAYDKLVAAAGKFGLVKVESHKTSIHLVRDSAFAGVATRKKHLVLTIKGDEPIKSARIFKSEQLSRNRYHHEVRISSPEEID